MAAAAAAAVGGGRWARAVQCRTECTYLLGCSVGHRGPTAFWLST